MKFYLIGSMILTLAWNVALAKKPLEVMSKRIETHQSMAPLQCAPGQRPSDEGLLAEIHCEISCLQGAGKSFKISDSFIPKNLGLRPGNGSNGTDMILWSPLTVTLKTWSEERCLLKAKEVCSGYEQVQESRVSTLESGSWQLKSFPGCKETKVTISPFDDNANSNRVQGIFREALSVTDEPKKSSISNEDLFVAMRQLKIPNGQCARPIKATVCFGDCIDLNQSATVETLGTPEPLGVDEVMICGDELYQFFATKKLSRNVKQQLCEAYFWNAMKLKEGMMNTCAAMRGDVDCGPIY